MAHRPCSQASPCSQPWVREGSPQETGSHAGGVEGLRDVHGLPQVTVLVIVEPGLDLSRLCCPWCFPLARSASKFTASLFFFFFLMNCIYFLAVPYSTCGILVSRPGIQPTPPALEVWSPNHWTTREVPTQPVLPASSRKELRAGIAKSLPRRRQMLFLRDR